MIFFNKIKTISKKEPKTFQEMVLKLAEETGEISQAVLSVTKASGSNYKNLNYNDVKEECIDVIIVAMSLLYKLGTTDEEIDNIANIKINKWENKLNQ